MPSLVDSLVNQEAAASEENPLSQGFDVVALTASADGLNALSSVLSALPANFPAAIVVVQHLSPQYPSLIAQILNRRTPLLVKEAQEGNQLSPGKVFIAPPDYHLMVNPDGSLSLSQTEKVHFVRPAAEILFESVAQSYKKRAIAVVLTGGDGDGSRGVQAIRKMGGKVIAQDKATSKVWGMPAAAIATGCVDWVLPLDKIGAALINLVMHGEIEGNLA
ncbi:MAG TPA: chemotaxis protein CheB [Cyanobacteria bacterium UBA8553]|nr:chemotaxis protein CheB [Cyanobacteria bacterium UBA8553]HAJ64392.1 chemotaxis protein CheB [Cyanobacteria bacterium UBA8543]